MQIGHRAEIPSFVLESYYIKSISRLFNVGFSLLLLIVLSFPILFIVCAIKITSKGPIIFWSQRVGQNNVLFLMPKFRTMKSEAPLVATHMLENPNRYVTKVGAFLRKTSLDELPQIWSILKGDMSFVGPRPALFNQYDLIGLRTQEGVHVLKPGLTGWAQINGRDEISIEEKTKFDKEYLHRKSLFFDAKIIAMTVKNVFLSKGISH